MSETRNNTITAEIPNIHRKVDIKDLDANGKLIPEENWDAVKLAVDRLIREKGKGGRITKQALNAVLKYEGIHVNFSITKHGDKYFAIYKGKKHDKSLGAGGLGSVKLVQDIDSGKWYAFKIMKIPNKNYRDLANKEVNALSIAKQLQGSEDRVEKGQFEMVMELGQGVSLLEFAGDRRRKMPAAKWLDMGISALKGIADLHQHGLYHRDIKGENLLADPTSASAKPIDLGFGIPRGNQSTVSDDRTCGTPGFFAPEVLNTGSFSEKTEVYALGRHTDGCLWI